MGSYPRPAVASFKQSVRRWAGELDVTINSVTVRPMRTKWASCSSAGNFTFNTEVLGLEQDLRDYVIIHELIHMRVPNHGKLWKSLMTAYVGDFRSLEQRLRVVASEGST